MLKQYHTKNEILKMLDELTEEEIITARLIYNKNNVTDYTSEDLFSIALHKKQTKKKYNEIMKAIESVKNAR